MKIGVDAMGGDYAPEAVVKGALLFEQNAPEGVEVVLYGMQQEISKYLPQDSTIEVVDCAEVIEMGDHPAEAFKSKPNSSIVKGFMHLAAGKIAGFASAGSTGAMMVGSMFVIKSVDGVQRPTIATHYLSVEGKPLTLLDVGLNADCKPEVLEQYATMGALYSEEICEVQTPRVALLNIGSEEGKGNLLAKATYEALKSNDKVNFVGNIEGKDLLSSEKWDVVVCDGFVGNILLKLLENLYDRLAPEGVDHPAINSMNYEVVGGTPVLGINSTVVIGHGASSPLAISNMIAATAKAAKSQMIEKLKAAFAKN